jgi:hypothetical protein
MDEASRLQSSCLVSLQEKSVLSFLIPLGQATDWGGSFAVYWVHYDGAKVKQTAAPELISKSLSENAIKCK